MGSEERVCARQFVHSQSARTMSRIKLKLKAMDGDEAKFHRALVVFIWSRCLGSSGQRGESEAQLPKNLFYCVLRLRFAREAHRSFDERHAISVQPHRNRHAVAMLVAVDGPSASVAPLMVSRFVAPNASEARRRETRYAARLARYCL